MSCMMRLNSTSMFESIVERQVLTWVIKGRDLYRRLKFLGRMLSISIFNVRSRDKMISCSLNGANTGICRV